MAEGYLATVDRRLESAGAPTSGPDTEPDVAGIALVPWPDQEDRRVALAVAGRPRVLLVDADAAPPRVTDPNEDWIRSPYDPQDLDARVMALVRRMDCGTARPILDDDGLLWFETGWVAVPDAQLPIVAALLARLGDVVSLDELATAYAELGGSDNRVAIKSMLRRLASRVGEIGLAIHTVRGRGYLLTVTSSCPLHPVSAGVGCHPPRPARAT